MSMSMSSVFFSSLLFCPLMFCVSVIFSAINPCLDVMVGIPMGPTTTSSPLEVSSPMLTIHTLHSSVRRELALRRNRTSK